MSEIKNYGKVAITVDGEWDSDKSYDRLCVVDYKGLSYISITDNTEKGVIPSNSSQWKLLSVPGVKGDQGPKGNKGDQGLPAVSYKNVTIFSTYNPTIEKPYPNKPIGGHWDISSDIIIFPEGWTNEDNIAAPVWMSIGTFSSLNPDNPTWTIPQRISGEKGNNGVDGVSQEFIYCLTKNQNIQPPVITNSNTDDYIPTGWEPSPKGIDEYNQVEWYAIRKKDSLSNWLDFEGPFIWSKWGVNGLDGDGVQYIFRLNKGEAIKNPIEEFNIDVNSNEYQEKGDYENIEFKPKNWTDNPQGVDSVNTHEWCCKRKFRNGVWGEYSDPALWAKYGENGSNGISIKTRYAVTDNSTEVPLINKTDKNPGSSWGSIIPHYESPQALWETQAYIDYKGDLVEVIDDDETIIYGWCDPILKSGIAGEKGAVPNYKSTYFCKADSIPNKPTYKTLSEVESSSIWLDYPNDSGQWWQSTAVIDGTTKGIISWGNVLQVNGQDGKAQDGKYWETRFAASPDDSAPELNKYTRDPSTDNVDWIKIDANIAPPKIPEGGSLWQSWAEIQPGGTALVDGWSDPYRVNGERGPRGYTGATGKQGPQGPSGLHGIDFDMLYCLGNETSYLATSAPNGNDYEGWYRNIPDIKDEEKEQGYIYLWACQGKKVYTDNTGTGFTYEWGTPFKLSGTNGLGEKGVGIKDVRNYYNISDSPTNTPSNWRNEGEIPQLSDDYPYLWNKEVIEYTDGTEKETTPKVISVKGVDGRNITEIIEYYYVGPEEQGVTIKDYTWATTPLYPNDVDIYLWNYEEIRFDKGDPIKTDPIRIGNYSKGEAGPIGKTVYPAGVYNNNTVYKTTKTTCPYVLDTDYGNYYILNADEWDATIQTQTPGQSFETYGPKYWTKMDFYEAIFAKVGLIANGLFGSAVFNGDYMFSQQGVDKDNIYSEDYHLFGQDINGNSAFDEEDNINLTRTDLAFYPNICFNFKTGATTLGKNKFSINNNGKIKIAAFDIEENLFHYQSGESYSPDFWICCPKSSSGIPASNRFYGIGTTDRNNRMTWYWRLGFDGEAAFSNYKCVFNPDGSGYLGKIEADDSTELIAIGWNTDGSGYLGKIGEELPILNWSKEGIAFKIGDFYFDKSNYGEITNLNKVYTRISSEHKDVSINNRIGHQFDYFIYDSDVTSFNINYSINRAIVYRLNGVIGEYCIMNGNNEECTVTLNFKIGTNTTKTFTFIIPANEAIRLKSVEYGYGSVVKVFKI